MAKTKRLVVGSICKPLDKDGTKSNSSNYLKIRGDTIDSLMGALKGADKKKGMTLRLESKARQLDNLDEAVSSGKISESLAEKVKERIEKIPAYVVAEVILVQSAE